MANELVKWNGGNLIKSPSPVEKSRQAREAAVALLGAQQQRIEVRGEQGQVAVSLRPYPGLPVDVPRICAVHGALGHGNSHSGLYAARYVFGKDGRFRLGSMIALTETLYMRQYAGNGQRLTVPSDDLGEETCPLCGACGHGSVLCHVCGLEVCYGRSSGTYFRCYPRCGGEGVMKRKARVQVGVTPVDMGWR